MKSFKYIVLFLIMGCSSYKVAYDYDIKTDFKKYKTYSFFEDVGEGLNEIDARRFTEAIGKHLDSIGLSYRETPDFYIHVISEKKEIPKNTNFNVGFGGVGRNGGVGVSSGINFGKDKMQEIITVDFVDGVTNKVFWQGEVKVAVKKITPQERVVLVKKIIENILSKYPPK